MRRDRAAGRDDGGDYLIRRAGDELIGRLDAVNRIFHDALDLGCGLGHLTAALQARGITMTSCDAGAIFAAGTEGVQCDEDRLPFPAGRFDLVVSAGVLDSVNDLPGALALVRRSLKPDGLFLGAFAGAGSLPMLRRAIRAGETAEGWDPAARIHPQIDLRAAGDLLTRAGFALPVVDREEVIVRFSSLARLVGDLRTMGATNLLAGPRPRPFGRLGLAAAMADFADGAGPDGKTDETFEIVYLSGWAPDPGQPKPARRGSATASLAEVLKPRV
jgi:SAM-dependent methyltransferase